MAVHMRRAVFLDRDGVINRALVRNGRPYPPATLSEVEILPGVRQAMLALHKKDWLLVVVTNQPDVARGTTPRAHVEAINAYLQQELPIDDFRTCFELRALVLGRRPAQNRLCSLHSAQMTFVK
jgi:D-glycero-D-manno-heptose 1,7-bisphosphate phosphatase